MYGADGLLRMSDQLWFSITMINTLLILASVVDWVTLGLLPTIGEADEGWAVFWAGEAVGTRTVCCVGVTDKCWTVVGVVVIGVRTRAMGWQLLNRKDKMTKTTNRLEIQFIFE